MKDKFTVLLADNSANFRESFAKYVLEPEGFSVLHAATPDEAKQILRQKLVHLAVVDLRLIDDSDQNDVSGLALCEEVDPTVARILLTSYPDWRIVRKALNYEGTGRRVADGFLHKTEDLPEERLKEIKEVLRQRFEILPTRRIAVLTSGGDAPGMNSAIHAIVRAGMTSGCEVMGVEEGYRGLSRGQLFPFRWNDVTTISHRGGTVLGSARYKEFKSKEGRQNALDHLISRHISGLIIIGGDGSMQGGAQLCSDLAEKGVGFQTVAIPGTIDNDLVGTDMSLGADTAANAMVQEVRNMVPPAEAMRRIFIVEVMGAYSGFLALRSGVGAEADEIFLPEELLVCSSDDGQLPQRGDLNATTDSFRAKLAHTVQNLQLAFDLKKRFGFVILAEAFQKLFPEQDWLDMARQFLESAVKQWPSGLRPEVRTQRLGYPIRGAQPTSFDVWLGARLGTAAVEAIINGKNGIMIGWKRALGVVEVPFEEVIRHSADVPAKKALASGQWHETLLLHKALSTPLPALW